MAFSEGLPVLIVLNARNMVNTVLHRLGLRAAIRRLPLAHNA